MFNLSKRKVKYRGELMIALTVMDEQTRRGILADFVDGEEGFVGWDKIIKIAEMCQYTPYYMKAHPFLSEDYRLSERLRLRVRDKLLVAVSFLTGGRISEVLMLRVGNFMVGRDFLFVHNMPLLKRFTKNLIEVDRLYEIPQDDALDYKWDAKKRAFIKYMIETISNIDRRDPFPIPLFEPLTDFLVSRLAEIKAEYGEDANHKWLFPTSSKIVREESPGVEAWLGELGLTERAWISPQRCWQIVTNVSERAGITVKLGNKNLGIWDHWFRSMRASQLVRDYVFTDRMLDRYFGWKTGREEETMSRRYARTATADMENQMKLHQERFDLNYKADLMF